MIRLKNLTKVYETINYNIIALSDLTMTFDIGEVIVLLGKSGSGKSTLLNIIGGFDRDYVGECQILDTDLKSKSERDMDTARKRHIGFVFQQYILLNNLTVIENVELALRVSGVVNAGSRRRAAKHALKLVGLEEHMNKFPHQISGGQKQRVAIARAFVKNPDIIIADEPTAALDSRTSKEILDLLADLCRNKLLIIATHNKSIVRDYASRVIELRSGYVVRNQLITDPSKVHVDELDLVIDKEIEDDDEKIQKLIEVEKTVSDENKSTVLKDMGLNIENFRLNNDQPFSIDEELKKRIIKEHMHNSKLSTRIYRFLQTSDKFYGKKSYANKAFFRNIGLHLFSAIIFAIFLLTIVFGLNFVSETFGGFNEKALYKRNMNNNNHVYFAPSEFTMEDYETTLYDSMEQPFINDFSQTELNRNDFYEVLLSDPYVEYQYYQDKLLYLDQELSQYGAINLYYNNASIIMREDNPDIIFEPLQYQYQNIVTFPEPYVYVSSFMDTELEENKIYQFNYLYAENNEAILTNHLLEGGELPDEVNEIVVPVAYLFQYEILNPSDFKDDYGNDLRMIPSERIQEAFDNLNPEQKTIDITKTTVTFNDATEGYNETYTTSTETFNIVGLINFDGDINPELALREDLYIPNAASQHFSFIVSKASEEQVNFDIIDNVSDKMFTKSIQYAEINNENYERYNVSDLEEIFETEYQNTMYSAFSDNFSEWIDTLNSATALVSAYVQDDLAGLNPDGSFLDTEIDNAMFEGLTYRDLLRYYIADHMAVISDEAEFNYLCPSCDFDNRSIESLYLVAMDAYPRIKQSSEYVDMLEHYGDVRRLTYQESTNYIMYQEYAHRFNNHFYETAQSQTYELSLVSAFEEERGSITSLVYVVLPRVLIENMPFLDTFVSMIERMEANQSFQNVMQQTNLDLLISSISTNAIRSMVMIILYIVIYLALTLSIVFLSFVLINLYGNIYETATRKRVRELASLRVLGTSYDDIHDMVKIENKRVALFSYLLFALTLFGLSRLDLFVAAPIEHFYMPLFGLFFDFNLYDVFVINPMVIAFATLLFYFFIYRFIIRKVSTKKIQNIDTIRAIRDGENV
ncbi:MAG: ATP-binding cassette domain-containing protein [Candidatus Izemoplasma sp.]|nr:ATP-binding cassette domain-containing protein [Candidatus Izemoplasma sp.]